MDGSVASVLKYDQVTPTNQLSISVPDPAEIRPRNIHTINSSATFPRHQLQPVLPEFLFYPKLIQIIDNLQNKIVYENILLD